MRRSLRRWSWSFLFTLMACGGEPPLPATTPATVDAPIARPTESAPPPVAPANDLAKGATNDAATAQEASCKLAARDVPGKDGEKRFVSCPAGCLASYHAVWGTDVYSDDSSVCAAAIHAGAITDQGGKALFDFLPGQPSYEPSNRGGVVSKHWGSWSRSFRVYSVDASGMPTAPKPPKSEDLPDAAGSFGCTTAAQAIVTEAKPEMVVKCPAGCTEGWTVYGSGPYTEDSPICRAALHAGVIGNEGGPVTVRRVPKQDKYKGSTKNGVTTSDWTASEYVGFTVAAAKPKGK